MLQTLRRLGRDDDGATAVEYAVMLGLILLVCLSSIAVLGSNTAATWQNNSDSISTAFGS